MLSPECDRTERIAVNRLPDDTLVPHAEKRADGRAQQHFIPREALMETQFMEIFFYPLNRGETKKCHTSAQLLVDALEEQYSDRRRYLFLELKVHR